MSWTRFTVDSLSSVAKAVYECQAIQDMRQGFGQLFRVPSFLNHAKQTRDLLEQSALSNIVNYALPIIMYRRAVDLSLDAAPDYIDPIIKALDFTVIIAIFARLYLLRAMDNTVFLLSLPRVIANDITAQLPIDLSQLLSQELASLLKDSILRNGQSEEDFRAELSAELLTIFTQFVVKNEFSLMSFAALQSELTDRLMHLIHRQDELAVLPEFIEKFSAILAKSIADTLSKPFQLTKHEVLEQDKRELIKTLKTVFRAEESEKIATNLFQKLDATTRRVQSSFPIKHHGPCGCGTLRLMRASLSTPLCHLGNVMIASSPGLLNQRGWFLPDVYPVARVAAYLMKIVIYGQSCDAEYKTAGHCTRHRYRVFSRNKAYSMGVGVSYVLGAELLAYALYQLSGVDNFFTRDALGNMVMQLIITATLAYREPLPGKRENTWDLFSLPRSATMTVAKKVHELFLPDLNRPESREKCYQYAKKKLSSPKVALVAKWFFSGSDFLPRYRLDVINEDLLSLILKRPAVKTYLELHRQDIQDALPTITRVHEVSRWIKDPVLVIPPSWISSFVVFPILFLKEDALKHFIDEFYLQIIAICQNKINYEAVKASQPRVVMAEAMKITDRVPVTKNTVEMELADALNTDLEPQSLLPVIKVDRVVDLDQPSIASDVPDSDLDGEDDSIYQVARACTPRQPVKRHASLVGLQHTMWKQVKVVTNIAFMTDGRRVDGHRNEIELKTF